MAIEPTTREDAVEAPVEGRQRERPLAGRAAGPRGNGIPIRKPSGATTRMAIAIRAAERQRQERAAPPAAGRARRATASAATPRQTGPRRKRPLDHAAEAARGEQREEQDRQREDRVAEEQRQVLQQRQLHGDEADAEAREVDDRGGVGRRPARRFGLPKARKSAQQHEDGSEDPEEGPPHGAGQAPRLRAREEERAGRRRRGRRGSSPAATYSAKLVLPAKSDA